jgi:tocopherol O-methyltransferase
MATTAQIREHYDSLASIYRTFWGDHIHHGLFAEGTESPEDAQVKMLDHCVRLLGLSGSEEVLDVGCGHGGTLLYLARSLDCRGTGITLSPEQQRIAHESAAKAGLANQLSFLVDDANTFQFPAAAYDLLWMMESSEHFHDKTEFFRRAVPALRQGGKLLVAAWTGSMESARVREVARAFLCPELWTPDQYSAAITAAGMKVTHCEDLTAQVVRTWEICRERAQAAGPAVKLLPRVAREFVESIDIILDAYRSGDLTYAVVVARKT